MQPGQGARFIRNAGLNLAYAVKNVTVTDRNTMLKQRIQELL